MFIDGNNKKSELIIKKYLINVKLYRKLMSQKQKANVDDDDLKETETK